MQMCLYLHGNLEAVETTRFVDLNLTHKAHH